MRNQAGNETKRVRGVLPEAMNLLRLFARDRVTVRTGLLLLIVIAGLVIAYILAQVATAFGFEIAPKILEALDLGRDGSLPERVNHGVAFVAAIVFYIGFLQYRARFMLSFSALMAFIWFDDVTRYHEQFGTLLNAHYDVPAIGGLRGQDTGELLAWGIAGLLLAIVFALNSRRSLHRDGAFMVIVLLPFSLLVFFGVIVDFLHVLAPEGLDTAVVVIEDGGEMVAVVLLTMCSIGIMRNAGHLLGPQPSARAV